MATIEDLDTELAAKLATLPSTPSRYPTDYLTGSGVRVAPGASRFMLRITALQEQVAGSNATLLGAQAEIQMLYGVSPERLGPGANDEGSVRAANVWPDQEALTALDYFTALDAVATVETDERPTVVEEIAREGNVMLFILAANVLLKEN